MARLQLQCFVAVALFVTGFSCAETLHLRSRRNALSEIDGKERLLIAFIEKDSENDGARVLKVPFENIERGTPSLNDFGIFDMKPWWAEADASDRARSPIYNVETRKVEVDCKESEECIKKVQEDIYLVNRYTYLILPDGKILEGVGLDRYLARATIGIGIFTLPEKPPTLEALEAYDFLLQIKMSMGRVNASAKQDFNFDFHGIDDNWPFSNIFDSKHSVYKMKVFGDVEFLARDDWGALKPIRRMNGTKTKADLVKVSLTTSSSTMPEKCLKEVRRLQRDQMRQFSDVFSNFIICGDGRVYEGLGWDLTRKENTVYFDFLVEPDNTIPWTQVLAAFTLKLREGIVLGKISKEFAIITPKISDTISKSIIAIGSLAKSLGENKSVVALKYSKAKENVPSRDFDGMRMHRLAHPISSVRFIQSEAICDAPKDCVPFSKMLDGEAVMSPERLTSNFYFFRENVVYEGFGWDWTLRQDEVALEFPTVNHTVPSRQAMFVSMLLIREGVINGYLKADYKTKMGKDNSEEFKNMVRFWDKRARG